MVEYQQFHMFEPDTVNSLKCFHFEADIRGSNKSCVPTDKSFVSILERGRDL